jgi:hypothetical protein
MTDDVRVLLDGLEVDTLAELRRLVGLGRQTDLRCPTCGMDKWRWADGRALGCVNAYCESWDIDAARDREASLRFGRR